MDRNSQPLESTTPATTTSLRAAAQPYDPGNQQDSSTMPAPRFSYQNNDAPPTTTMTTNSTAMAGAYQEYDEDHLEQDKMDQEEELDKGYTYPDVETELEWNQNHAVTIANDMEEEEDDYAPPTKGNVGPSMAQAHTPVEKEEEEDDVIIIDNDLLGDPVFLHLTTHLSFSQQAAGQACKAVANWSAVLVPPQGDEPQPPSSSSSRAKLSLVMDWLCLHLKEQELEAGFRPKKKQSSSSSNAIQLAAASNRAVRAIPHPSITVSKKLTLDAEWTRVARLEERAVGFLRFGFLHGEILAALEATTSHQKKNDDDEAAADPSPMEDRPTLVALMMALEQEVLANPSDSELADVGQKGTEEHADRNDQEEVQEEREALSAIYDHDFHPMGLDEATGQPDAYRISFTVEDWRDDGMAACDMHVWLRPGYPSTETPLFLLRNPKLPWPFLRRINLEIIKQARECIGRACIFEIVTFLNDSAAELFIDFQKEERTRKFEATQTRLRKEAGHTVKDEWYEDSDDPSKKLGRRQKARLKGAEKAYDREDNLQQLEEERQKRQAERLEKIRQEDQLIRQTMAERAIAQREKERHEEDMQRAGRAAMSAAFNRGESVEEARAAAKKAEAEFRGEYGVEEESRASNETGAPTSTETPTTNVNGSLQESSDAAESSAATPTTVAFMERLRNMYASAAEKKYNLSEPVVLVDEVIPEELPCPVAAPTGDLEQTLEEIVSIQKEQPWLLSDEARAPGARPEMSPQQAERQGALDKKLREELESKMGRRSGSGGKKAKDYAKIRSQREGLPAFKMAKEIVSTINRSQVTVISGDTGCGKTTQCAQLVLDDMILRNFGSQANMIVTQPRRISAIGVSERISQERCERVGETCGYSIKLEHKISKKTRLLLCTTGILLRRLQCDPDLASVSHIFVDEVHERDLDTDFLLIILKSLLARRKSLRLVLMSATINADAFAAYFSGCATISIPGRTHPVKEFRLEDVLQITGYAVPEHSDYAFKERYGSSVGRLSKSALRKMYYPRYSSEVINSLAIVDESIINYELIAALLEHICENNEEGAILCFVPGMMEISRAIDELRKKPYFQSDQVVVLPLHSSMSTAEQSRVFDIPPKGIRKIVVSTNIAETSVTLADVVFVVDAGRVKELRRDEVSESPALVETFVSRASAKQRRGRAGRVKPGVAYHLFSSHTNENLMQDHTQPEMLRVGLEGLALQILILDLGEPHLVLAKALNPPSALGMRNALNLLTELGAVECEWIGKFDEKVSCGDLNVKTELTALGFHLASLPVEPRIGKLMIYGALFGCVEAALTIAASMSSKSPFVSPFEQRDAAETARKAFSVENSDHLTVLAAFNKWKQLKGGAATRFLRDNYLSRLTLSQMEELRKQYSSLLVDIGFLAPDFRLQKFADSVDSVALVKAVLCAGLYPNIIVGPRSLVDGSSKQAAGDVAFGSRSKGDVYLHPCTLSHKAKNLDSRYACFASIVKTSKMYIRDCTAVSPISLLLFGGALTVHHSRGVVSLDDWLLFRMGRKPATLIKHVRSQMETALLKKIVSPTEDLRDSAQAKALVEAVKLLLTASNEDDENDVNRADGAEIVKPWRGSSDADRDRHARGRGRGRSRGGRGSARRVG